MRRSIRTLSKAFFLTLATEDEDMGLAASAFAVVVVAAATSGLIVVCLAMLCAKRLCSPIERAPAMEIPGPQPDAAFFPTVAQLMMFVCEAVTGGWWLFRRREVRREIEKAQ